jgi:hypothetical protein
MTDSMTHDILEQLLPAAALEILEGEELLRVTAHAAQCAECARLLESYREVLSSVATTLPLRRLDPTRSDRLRARLLLRAGHPPAPASAASPARRLTQVVDRWAGWAVAAALAGVLLVHHSVHRPLAYGWLAAGILTIVILALAIYIRHLRTRMSALDRRDDPKTGDQRKPPFPE